MSKTKKADPTLPFTPIALRGEDYKMCFDFGAIGQAEQELRKQGCGVYLIFAPWSSDILVVTALFAASLAVYHPEIDFEAAKALVGWDTAIDVMNGINAARAQFMPEEEKKPNPPQAPGA